MKRIIAVSLACTFIFAVGCGNKIISREEMSKEFPAEEVSITKQSFINGLSFYVPDEYISKMNKDSTECVIDTPNFYLKSMIFSGTITDYSEKYISSVLSNITGYTVKASDIKHDSNGTKSKCKVYLNKKVLDGTANIIDNGGLIIAASKNPQTENITSSLTVSENVIQINDPNLTATVNDIGLGTNVSIEDVKQDFEKMGLKFNEMKQETSDVTGKKIQDIKKQVNLNFKSLSERAKDVDKAYFASIEAYNNAVKEFNIKLSNGVNFQSQKEDIEKQFGIKIKPDWTKYVIINTAEGAKIKSISIDMDNNKIKSMKINSDVLTLSEMSDKLKKSLPESNDNSFVIPDLSSTSSQSNENSLLTSDYVTK